MENELLDELLLFSNDALNIPLNETRIEKILHIDNELLQYEFTDENSYLLQNCLIKADDKQVNVILKNLSVAIKTICRNNIDLSKIEIPENFGYSLRTDITEKSIRKIYKNHVLRPRKEREFKEIWLKGFIQNLEKINFSIRYILDLPNTEQQAQMQELPQLPKKLILFDSPETVTKIHDELKGYFAGHENELLEALNGKKLQNLILFPHNQNKFVEVFKRAKYNNLILSNATEIKKWICSNFSRLTKGQNEKFNNSSVWDILSKDKGEPTKKERICIVDWMPYRTYNERQD